METFLIYYTYVAQAFLGFYLFSVVFGLLFAFLGVRLLPTVYLMRNAESFDQLINTLLGGDIDETITSRAGKGRLDGKFFWTLLANFLDMIDKDHCYKYIEWDEGRTKTNPSYKARLIAEWRKQYKG